MKFILPLFSLIVLAIIFQINWVSAAAVSASFDIKDSNGAALSDTLIIIQGITNPDFSQSKLTDSTGKASFNINQNELFVYIVHKLGYEEKTGSFLANSNKNFPLSLAKLPDNQWFFYRFNNGELEFRFKSLDTDTNYVPGEYIKKTLEIRNVNNKEISLVDGKGIYQVIDAETNKSLRAWGDFDLTSEGDFSNLVLKKDGLIEITFTEGEVEVCASNVKLTYSGLNIELSGGETLCVDEDQERNRIPEWILENEYKFKIERFYKIDGQERSFAFTSQEFFIDSSEWKPEIISSPETGLNSGQEWTYQAQIKSFDASFSPIVNLLNYKLVEAPAGMNVTQSGLVTWTPSQAGEYDVVLRAYHEYFEGNSAKIAFFDQSFTLNVQGSSQNSAPQITSAPIKAVNENSVYSYDVQAVDANNDALTYTVTGASWLSIDSSTGLLQGTAPNVTADTSFNIIVTVSDGTASDQQTYILTVSNLATLPTNTVPVITSTPGVTEINENTAFAYQVVAKDADGDNLTYTLTQKPNWLSINSNTGLITGLAPSIDNNEQFTISISVADGRGGTAIQDFTLKVNDLFSVPENNTAPNITSAPLTTVNEKTQYTYQVMATDAEDNILTYTLTNPPTWLSINAATGILSGMAPEVTSNTTFAINIIVSDGKSTSSQFYFLKVLDVIQTPKPENQPPKIISQPVIKVNERVNYNYQVASTDENGDALTYSITQGPGWLTIDSNTGFIQGMAPEVASGTDFHVIVSVSDDENAVTQNYILTVNNIPKTSRKNHKTKVLPDLTSRFYEALYPNQQWVTVSFAENNDNVVNVNSIQSTSLEGVQNSAIQSNSSAAVFLLMLNLYIIVLIILIKFL